MSQSPPARSRRSLLAGLALLALISCAVLVWRHGRMPVQPADLSAFLERTVGAGNLRFSATRIETLRRGDTDLQLSVTSDGWTRLPLYTKMAAADYLLRTFQLDPDSTAELRRQLANRDTAKDPDFARAGPLPADPYLVTMIKLTAPAGAPFTFHGVIDAHREGDAWDFSIVSSDFEGVGPLGQARSAFGDASLVPGDAEDDARLRGIVADFQAFSAKVAAIRRDSGAARRGAFLERIAPGRAFRGVAIENGEPNGIPLYLEITGVSPENEVTAFLRNDGGWHNARVFEGTWSADDEFENPTLNLSSSADEAVRNGGPILENTQNWPLELHMDPQGGLSGRNEFFQYRFEPLGADQLAALKGRLEAEYEQASAATEPGLLYQGSAVSRASGDSEAILLRFIARPEGGQSIEAGIESVARPWKRSLHGVLVDNARRSGGKPIRLRSAANEAVEDAPSDSVLGDPDDLDIKLGLEDGSLVGEDGKFAYRLDVASDANLRRLEADRTERARRFMVVLRNGITYDGTSREEQGFTTASRLEIDRIDRKTNAVAARIYSLDRPNIYREFLGTCNPSTGSMELGATGRGAFSLDGSFDIPFLTSLVVTTLHLELTGSSITGRIEGNPHWAMEFPVGAFLSAPTEGPEPGSPAANGSVFPSFPKTGGAYLLSRGVWSPLPRNNGHIVVETVRPSSELELPTNIVGIVTAGINQITREKEKKKVPYLEFDGKDPRPESNGQAIVILFVGTAPTGTPPVELAPAETLKDGQRRLEILGGTPGEIRFGAQRVAGFPRQAGPGYILFTTTSALEPGPYVFNADMGYELTQR